MAIWPSIQETTDSLFNDEYLLEQSGIAKVQTRDVLAESLKASLWLPTINYLKGSRSRGSDGNIYVALQSNGNSSTVQDPTTDVNNQFWIREEGLRQVQPLTTQNGRFRSGMVLTTGVALPANSTYTADEEFVRGFNSGSGTDFAQGVTVTDAGIVHTGGNIYTEIDLGSGFVGTASALTLYIVDNNNVNHWLTDSNANVNITVNGTVARFEWTSALYASLSAATFKEVFGQKEIGVVGVLDESNTVKSDVALSNPALFNKSISSDAAFSVSGGNISSNCAINVVVGSGYFSYQDETQVLLPSLTQGTDYAIYATKDGLIASNNFTAPSGYTVENSRRIGGFHYQDSFINERSIWDLKYKPNCDDPRGMVRTIGGFWADIYLLNTTPDLLGTSAYNAQIADGDSRPKKPISWGGDGVAQYTYFTQLIATEVLAAYGKRLPSYHEFTVLAYGSVTGYISNTDPVKTKFDSSARSSVGCEQVSGHMYQWGSECWDRGNGDSGYVWADVNTDGKGEVYTPGLVGIGGSVFGAYWANTGLSGSCSSYWRYSPWASGGNIASRGVCDHMQIL